MGSSHRTLSALAAITLAWLGLTPDANAIRVRHDVPIEAYNALANQEQFRAVGYVRAENMGCTGALVAPDMVLTAAHCLVHENGTPISPSNVTFIIDHPGSGTRTYRAKYVDIHPEWDRQRNKHTDVALITLDREVEHVTPLALTSADPHEHIATMIGYGTQGTGNDTSATTSIPGAFRKIAAQNVVDRLRHECCNSGNYVIQVDFDHPTRNKRSSLGDRNPLPLEGGASFGDSGSPLLVRFGERDFIVGVASYITGAGKPGPTGYGEVAGYQWIGSGEVMVWLDMLGVTVWDNPFSAPSDITLDAPEEQPTPDAGSDPTDMDGDDRLTVADAAALLDGLTKGDARSDINRDGSLDTRDAAKMLEALGYSQAVYPKKKQWKRAVRDLFRNQIEPYLVGLSKKERRRAEKVLKQAHRFVGA